MSKRRLVITAVLAGSTQSEVARIYGVTQGWVSRLMARYREEGVAAYEPRSRRPHSSPNATPAEVVDLVLRLRKELTEQGHDAGPDTLAWHLRHRHDQPVPRSTIHRILTRAGAITPDPAKRPKSSYLRFEAEQPNETWQSDFTHYRLTRSEGTPGADTEILNGHGWALVDLPHFDPSWLFPGALVDAGRKDGHTLATVIRTELFKTTGGRTAVLVTFRKDVLAGDRERHR